MCGNTWKKLLEKSYEVMRMNKENREKLILKRNSIDWRWKVMDGIYAVGDGSTPYEAIRSARIVTQDPIYWENGELVE